MNEKLRVLVVGCGHMGSSHALAYEALAGFEICGLVSRNEGSRNLLNKLLGKSLPTFSDYAQALKTCQPDAVCISTYPDTHAIYARMALEAGCHVFLEKPIALGLDDARTLIQLSHDSRRKLVVGYILQHHPAWSEFVKISQKLGKPLVMRMNLNQQSSGAAWQTHRNIMNSMSPIVDCGVHYVDVMCRMTGAQPLSVHAIGARLSEELNEGMYNYGALQVRFDDGSVGWYEAGWGPMMSQTAYFVKDVIGPKGSVSIVADQQQTSASDDVNSHTKTNSLLIHHAERDQDGSWSQPDTLVDTQDEPDHNGLCRLEQEFFLHAIREDIDLSEHLASAYRSLQIVLAADESIHTGRSINL